MEFINVKISLPHVFPPHNLPHSQVRLQPHVSPHTPFLIPPHVSPHVLTSHLAPSYAPYFLLPHLLAHIYNTPTITPCFALCIPPQLLPQPHIAPHNLPPHILPHDLKLIFSPTKQQIAPTDYKLNSRCYFYCNINFNKSFSHSLIRVSTFGVCLIRSLCFPKVQCP